MMGLDKMNKKTIQVKRKKKFIFDWKFTCLVKSSCSSNIISYFL